MRLYGLVEEIAEIAVKTKTFTILKSNETVIIPKKVILKLRILYDIDRRPGILG